MKSIINGKRFDTDKAVVIGGASYGHGVNDFNWWSATLYRTPRAGRYFLAGEGGGLTRFRRSLDGNGFTRGERLIPMTDRAALEWAEQNLDAETVEEHFGDAIEDA